MIRFTATQRRILAVLSDGLPHSKAELEAAMLNEFNSRDAIHFHITKTRQKLLQKGETILCQASGRTRKYIHVRLLSSPNDD
jgi:hypothetical protein